MLIFFGSVIGIIVLFAGAVYLLGEAWINKNLVNMINSKPDRKYDFLFTKVDFNIVERSIEIDEVEIIPLDSVSNSFVKGKVDVAYLSGINLKKLVLEKDLTLEKLKFINADFVIHHKAGESKKKASDHELKSLFGDILSRGLLEEFQIEKGSALILDEGKEIGYLKRLDILATGLVTDSLVWNNMIPFKYDRISLHIDSLFYDLQGQQVNLGKFTFDTAEDKVKFENLSFTYSESLEKASQKMQFQTDLIYVELDSMVFMGLESNSRFQSDLDVRADKLTVAGLNLKDFRNKSKPRPNDEIKPMFQGMLQKVNFPLKLDSLILVNGHIAYSENVPEKGESWELHWTELNGHIVNVTTIPEFQNQLEHFDASVKGKVKGEGILDFKLKVPYDKDAFNLEVELKNFDLTTLNSTLKPIMNGDVTSGHMDRLKLVIKATEASAHVDMIFDYKDLKVEMFNKKGEKKNIFSSTAANLALNHANLPGEKKYVHPSFLMQRNRSRGPFYLIWQSTKEGMLKIVPGGAVKTILKSAEK